MLKIICTIITRSYASLFVWDSKLARAYRINRFFPCCKILCIFWYDSEIIPFPPKRVMACNLPHVEAREGTALPGDSPRMNGM